MLVSCSDYYSTLKMEAICSSEASVNVQWPRLYIPEDRTLHNHRCENFKSYKCYIVLIAISMRVKSMPRGREGVVGKVDGRLSVAVRGRCGVTYRNSCVCLSIVNPTDVLLPIGGL
jgi:hypothetical protein